MALEAVLIATLFCADLAVPAQSLQAFRFHLVSDLLRRAHLSPWHCGVGCRLGT